MIQNFLNSRVNQNPSSSYGTFTEEIDLAYWWSFSGGVSALQPVQQFFFVICVVMKICQV